MVSSRKGTIFHSMWSSGLDELGRWMTESGPLGDVVFSSRIRLARNLSTFSFTHWGSEDDRAGVRSMIRSAVRRAATLSGVTWIDLDDVDELNRRLLVERHLISVEFSEAGGQKAAAIDKDQCISMMVNEEDHIRLQTLQPGLRLKEAWTNASKIDEEFAALLPYAFSQRWGYLTACPSNVGTGLRASVLMHLAGLAHYQQLGQVLNASQKLGLAVRGFYGEGSQAQGNLIQLSNQASLGLSEAEILENLETRVKQIASHEMEARRSLAQAKKVEVEDRIWRSWAILSHARMISSQEAMDLLSDVRLGVELGFLPVLSSSLLSELLILIQPAHLQSRTGKELEPEERDIARAELIRSKLSFSP